MLTAQMHHSVTLLGHSSHNGTRPMTVRGCNDSAPGINCSILSSSCYLQAEQPAALPGQTAACLTGAVTASSSRKGVPDGAAADALGTAGGAKELLG